MSMNRRDFMKTSAAATAVAASTTVFTPQADAKTGELAYEGEAGKWVSTTCQGCTSWCPVQGLVVNGKVVKMRGHPLSSSQRICPRPHLALQQVYDPDRVRQPMKRTNPRKGKGIDPQFVPISWDEAIDTIADKFMELIKNDETHKFVLFRGRYTHMNDIFYGNFPKLLGSTNNISHSSICAEAEKYGRMYTEGLWNYPDADLDNTQYLLGWGWDGAASNRQTPWFMKKIGELSKQGRITTIDPRLSATAAKSGRWLPIIPGTDSALAVAIAHVILAEGVWNKGYVGDFMDNKNYFVPGQQVPETITVDGEEKALEFKEIYTYGVVKWWNLELFQRTPEWAEPITGISAQEIREVAREFAAAGSKAVSWVTPGCCMQVRGAAAAHAAHALNGLVGSCDSIGGTLRNNSSPSASAPKIDDYLNDQMKNALKRPKIDKRGSKQLPALNRRSGGGVVTQEVARSILDEDPYDVKMAMGYWNNFVFSINGADVWEKAMEKLPFYIHITPQFTEMTMYADIVLPTKLHMFERWGYSKSSQNLHGQTSIHQPLIKTHVDARTDETEIPFMIAQSLAKKGYDAPLRYFQNEFKDPHTGKHPQTPEEFDLIAVKMATKPVWDGSNHGKGDTINGWDDFVEKGVFKSPRKKIGTLLEKGFPTETKKFEFYSETLKKVMVAHAEKHGITTDEAFEAANYTCRGDLGYVGHYEPVVRHGNEREYPFIFSEHRSRLNREGRSQNTPWYYEMKDVDPGDVAEKDVTKINPIDAKKYGFKDGDKVRITSPQGSIESEIKLWEGTRPGVVVKCYGQGHWAYGRVGSKVFGAKPRGGNNNAIHAWDYERLSGSTPRHGGVSRVKIEKI